MPTQDVVVKSVQAVRPAELTGIGYRSAGSRASCTWRPPRTVRSG
ncbi:hypothetical protein [Streptomyces sp. NPDC006307]